MANVKYSVKYIEIWAFFQSSFPHIWPKPKDLPWFLATYKHIMIRRKPMF